MAEIWTSVTTMSQQSVSVSFSLLWSITLRKATSVGKAISAYMSRVNSILMGKAQWQKCVTICFYLCGPEIKIKLQDSSAPHFLLVILISPKSKDLRFQSALPAMFM